MTLEERIKTRGRELGFDLIGITAAAPFSEFARAESASTPQHVREAARSIVSVAMNYYTGEPPQAGGDLCGRIARFAWGDDYHLVMEARLRALSGFLMESGASLARHYVDTGPMRERVIAQRAGLGWCGRHSCLITEAFGTWVVLGEVLTDLALQPDLPASGDCGSCEACMVGATACPSGAIVAPGVVDASRCIAYWTIEHRGWIPREVRPTLQDMIFGCDLCQEVCPFNGPPKAAMHPEFLPRPETGPRPHLPSLLSVPEEEYRRLFRRSAIKRAGRRGLRRNVAIALGNAGDARAVPDLTLALRDLRDPVLRGHAAWALGRIGGPEASDALRGAHTCEDDPRVLEEIVVALETPADAALQRRKPVG